MGLLEKVEVGAVVYDVCGTSHRKEQVLWRCRFKTISTKLRKLMDDKLSFIILRTS